MTGKGETKLEWRFVDETEWQAILVDEAGTPAGNGVQQGRNLCGLSIWLYPMIILLAALITLYVYMGQRERNTSLPVILQQVVQEEAVAWRTQNLTQLAHLLDPQADPDWQAAFLRNRLRMYHRTRTTMSMPTVTVQTVERQDDLALVAVVVTDAAPPWLSMPYREVRFYRQVVGRWLRTAPDPIFWGAPRAIDTTYFHFAFHQRDAADVESVAKEIDAIYRRLHRGMGLSAPAAEEQWWIDIIVADASHQRSTTIRRVKKRLFVPAPALWSAPVERSDAAILRALVIEALSDQLILEARRQIKPKQQWLPITAGVARWLSQQWGGDSAPAQQRYEEEHHLRRWLEGARPLRLADLTAMPEQPPLPGDDAFILLGFTSQEEYDAVLQIRVGVAQSVIAYAVATYGQERLPVLLKALGAHTTWKTLIPAVFGVPAAQFEAGWQAYLRSTIQ